MEDEGIGPLSREDIRASAVPFDRIPFDHQHCFLCGAVLPEETSKEHVFPKWLLHRFDLWDSRLSLLNGTSIAYRDLMVPSCVPCNTGPLSRLEDRVRTALDEGYQAVLALDQEPMFQWMGKLLWGIIFKEVSLSADRKNPGAPSIFPPSQLDDFASLHDLLQSIRVPCRFQGGPFYSVLVCRLHDLGGWRPFDFADSIDDHVVGMRLGTVGLVASLSDGGVASHHWSKVLSGFNGHPLHPIQFDEMLAHVVALRRRLVRPVRYVAVANRLDGSGLSFTRLPGFSLEPPVGQFDEGELRGLLRHYLHRWGPATEAVWARQDGVGTTIFERPGHVALCDAEFQVLRVVPYE